MTNRSEKRAKRKIGSESVERIVEQARQQSIQDKVQAFEAKRQRLIDRKARVMEKNKLKRQEEELSTKLLECLACGLFCKKKSNEEKRE